jgi:NADH-quinone oxidoreductase subunit E
MEIVFSIDKLNKVSEIISRYPEGKQKSALLPVLHIAQTTFGGASNGLCSFFIKY